jgi:competence protein ComEA
MDMFKKGFLAVLLGIMLSASLVFADDKININTATMEQLQTLSGVGQSTAMAIIKYRDENGAFKTVKQLANVKGIGDKKISKWSESLSVKDSEL